jgi:hypothetical protein
VLLLLLLGAPVGLDIAAETSREVARQECRSGSGWGKDADVTVCGRRTTKNRYQVSDPQRWDPSGQRASVLRERMSWIEEGDTGPGACGAVGPGGWTGCMVKDWKRKRQQAEGW